MKNFPWKKKNSMFIYTDLKVYQLKINGWSNHRGLCSKKKSLKRWAPRRKNLIFLRGTHFFSQQAPVRLWSKLALVAAFQPAVSWNLYRWTSVDNDIQKFILDFVNSILKTIEHQSMLTCYKGHFATQISQTRSHDVQWSTKWKYSI